MNWYNLSVQQSFELTKSSENGISSQEANYKLQQSGLNLLKQKKQKSRVIIFISQFKDFMVLVLIFAAIISGVIGDITDTIIILVLVILNAIIGFFQEYSAEKAMEALNKITTFYCLVMRDGITHQIPSMNLVVGDVVLLSAGNIVPADVRLIESFSLRIDESSLTGESVAVDKIENELNEENIAIGDRINIAYKGTLISNGRGKGLVVETGMNTEIGKIANLLQEDETATPLQKRLTDFGKKISFIVIGICVIIFIVGLLRGEELFTMLLLSISLSVAAIPEALPALITITMASGAKRLVKQNALIKKLSAVETLGSVSFICSDKTGTLTMNKMKVVQVYEETCNINPSPLYSSMLLNNDIKIISGKKMSGDPTEVALVEYCSTIFNNQQCDDIISKLPKVAELPFDSFRKCMTSIHKMGDKYIVFSKGAIESISKNLLEGDNKEIIHLKNIEWAKEGKRVLAFAYKIIDTLPKSFTSEVLETNLKLAGLVGMIDPPRMEVKTAIIECKLAGIKPVMITGDHLETAKAIAKEIGIIDNNSMFLTGTELQDMSVSEFEDKVDHISLYARVSPEQKINIIKALQLKGYSVAMTGDGVNDAPSLKAADIGVAMGITGTDVSKEAAHMILLDDNYATIIKAIKEGRRIYDNIRKFVKYILTCNSAEIWIIILAPLVGLPIPLLPIHILWINLATDGLPGLALTNETAEINIMKRPPRKNNESLFSDGIVYHIVWIGLIMTGVVLGLEAWTIHQKNENWQTMVFTVLSLSQLGHVLSIRSEHTFLYKQGIFSNLPLIITVLLSCVLQLIIIYIPITNDIFKTQPLKLNELMICIGLSIFVFHAAEFEKWIRRRVMNKKMVKSLF